jgi:Tol biopolymer transport system component
LTTRRTIWTGLGGIPAAVLALGGAIATVAEGQSPAAAYASDSAIPQARPYAPNVITTVNGLAFDPDGRTLYASREVDDLDGRGRRRVRIVRYRFAGERWSGPEAVSFSTGFTDYQPVLGPDGSRMFFTSTRPLPGTSVETRQNIWVVDRVGDDWGTPRAITELASPGWDGYAVLARSGRLYFVSDRAGGRGAVDIWTADPSENGRYADPVNVAALNSAHSDSDIFVDPEERFIVFHRFVEADRSIDLWIAFRTGGVWRAPRQLGEVNGRGWELSPTVSPDGRYFFFNRDGVVHRVDFCALVRAEEQAFLSDAGSGGRGCGAYPRGGAQ